MNFARIKARVRANVGYSGVDDLSNTRLEEAINHVYTRLVPHIVNWKGLQQWVYFDLADGVSTYDFDTYAKDAPGGTVIGTRLRCLEPPPILVIDANGAMPIHFTYDWDGFWKKWPPYANEPEGTPSHALIKGRTLHVRSIPETSYTLKVWGNMRPSPMSQSDNEPVEDWAETIILGGTAEIIEDDEDQESAGYWWQLFNIRVGNEVAGADSKPLGRVKSNW